MQSEAVAVGGSGLGVALALAPLWLVAEAGFGEWRWFAAGVLSALAMGHEPLVGLVALGGVVPAVAVTLVQERRRWTELVTLVAAGLPLGFIPLGLGLWRSVLPLEYKLSVSLFHQWAGEWASSPPVAGWSEALAWQGDQLGMVALVLALLGALLGAVMVPSREVAAGLFGVWASALVAQAFGVALGPTRFGATALAATCALAIFATGGMQFLSRLLARMKVPMAEMSAGLVVMMFLVLPLKILDDTLMHFAGRRGDASAVWGTQVFGAMPERAVLLVSDPALHRRCLVARATGFLREDVLVIPLFDLASAEVIRATAQEPKLIPLIRDLMLGNAPEEWSLATVLEARPLVMTFEPSWPSALARHFMALGPFERFEPEPHGHTDRRRALDAWSDGARRLFDVSSPLEPELRALTGHLAQRRWLAFASNRDKDLLETVQSQFQGILQERGVEFSSKELDVPGTLIPTVTIPGEKGPWNPKTCASCFRKTAFAK
jgi:hypothetical protein